MQSKGISDKLPYTCPDRGLAYCGIGLVLYNTEEYELALRSFLKVREIREKLYGTEHSGMHFFFKKYIYIYDFIVINILDTATVYNNLGCCMYMLERNKEAEAYF